MEFHFASEVGKGSFVEDVDNTEEEAIVLFAPAEEFNMDGQYSLGIFQKNYYLLVDNRFLCMWAIIVAFEDTDHLNFL